VRSAWAARQAKRASPLLLVIAYSEASGERLAVCGPVGEQPPVLFDLEADQVERLCAAALGEPSRHAAVRFLTGALPEVGADFPGVRNTGLLATHELRHGVPQRLDWPAACRASGPLLGSSGRSLVERLGFRVQQLSTQSSVLTVGEARRAVAVFLDEEETFDDPAERFRGSPVSHALALADREGLPWVVLTRGRQIRLYAASPNVGVGRKGRAETFVELNLALLPTGSAGYLKLLFGAEALAAEGTLEEIVERSADYAAELGSRLRDRVYFEAVPRLAIAVATRLHPGHESEQHLADAYEETLVILFRLLFVAYGEDKDLLPYHTHGRYHEHALKGIARRLADAKRTGMLSFDEEGSQLWGEVTQLWHAVGEGRPEWGVPAYGGDLFSADAAISRAGAALAGLHLTDAECGPALAALLVDEGSDGVGPVDFRSLSVREFGTIYEGLLESRLSVAQADLTINPTSKAYVPAGRNSTVAVRAGEVYFHHRSGTRKATGSYFTKPFAVEHLLAHALEPALDDHLRRLQRLVDAGDDAAAADGFFDFRCVDLAMGSAHFLVAAVDHIERRLSAFLALHPIQGVSAELDALRQAALGALGELAPSVEIENTSLLRRQIARRCIYGVDRNRIAVELARLAVWIHTFVPGLPLSFLDHNLTEGDSLTGIGTLDEAALAAEHQDKAQPGKLSFAHHQILEFLIPAQSALRRLATVTEALTKDVETARAAHEEALAAVEPARVLFDLLVAARLGAAQAPITVSAPALLSDPGRAAAAGVVKELGALHLPVAFPEVFVRDNPGFDCVVGNPPWEEATVEELGFWALRYPGLKGLSGPDQRREMTKAQQSRPDLAEEYERALVQAETTRRLLLAGPYPGMNTGDPDLYKAFCWRFWQLSAATGVIGVVLPRSVFTTKGSALWRQEVLPRAALDIVITKNRSEWLFTDVNPGYSICLVTIRKGISQPRLVLRGTYASEAALIAGTAARASTLEVDELLKVDPLLCVPAIEDQRGLELFSILIRHPPLGATERPDFEIVPVTELHATHDGKRYFTGSSADYPVYNHRNIGHFRFEPEQGVFNYVRYDEVIADLMAKRRNAARRRGSPFARMPPEWAIDSSTLPAENPRIAIRDVVHASNARKVWAALVPSRTILTNKAPYLLFPRGTITAQAYVLGILGSGVCDWYGHLRIVLNLNYFILNAIPIPVFYHNDERAKRISYLAVGLSVRNGSKYAAWRTLADPIEDPSARDAAICELNALVSVLYEVPGRLLPVIFNGSDTTRPPLSSIMPWREKWSGGAGSPETRVRVRD